MTPIDTSSNVYMTTAEFARHTRLSRRTIQELIAAGLPSLRIGKARRILWQEADLWLRTRDAPPGSAPIRRLHHPTCPRASATEGVRRSSGRATILLQLFYR